MSKFRTMKRETAEKIAAADSGIPFADVVKVVKYFIEELGTCPVCEGTHRFTYRERVQIPVEGMGRNPELQFSQEGETGACPLCGPEGKGDPEWVIWHCRDAHNKCNSGNQAANGHEKCGWILALPWE